MAGRTPGPVLVLVTTVLLVLTGCGSFPVDPDGTLERVRGGELRVGVSPNPPWTEVTGRGDPTGTEPDLVRAFAATLDAEVAWRTGGEEALVHDLERSELDLVIGGLTADTPWSEHVAVTTPYAEVRDDDGETEPHVMAAPLGENAFLVELERFLRAQELR